MMRLLLETGCIRFIKPKDIQAPPTKDWQTSRTASTTTFAFSLAPHPLTSMISVTQSRLGATSSIRKLAPKNGSMTVSSASFSSTVATRHHDHVYIPASTPASFGRCRGLRTRPILRHHQLTTAPPRSAPQIGSGPPGSANPAYRPYRSLLAPAPSPAVPSTSHFESRPAASAARR